MKVERDAQELADSLGVKIFQADIIYHLFDKFMAYREELRQRKREEFKHIAVFPCKLKVLPQVGKNIYTVFFYIGTADYISVHCFLDVTVGIPVLLVLLFVIVESLLILKSLTETVIVHSSHSLHVVNTAGEGMTMRYSHYISKYYKTVEWMLTILWDVHQTFML